MIFQTRLISFRFNFLLVTQTSIFNQIVNNELKQVKKRFGANKLLWNVDKTSFVIFHSPKTMLDKAINVKIGKDLVKQAKYVKFLGILLDESLTWKYHLTELSKKLTRTCGIAFKIRHLLPTSVLVSLSCSLFSSFLQYGITVWGLTYISSTKESHESYCFSKFYSTIFPDFL